MLELALFVLFCRHSVIACNWMVMMHSYTPVHWLKAFDHKKKDKSNMYDFFLRCFSERILHLLFFNKHHQQFSYPPKKYWQIMISTHCAETMTITQNSNYFKMKKQLCNVALRRQIYVTLCGYCQMQKNGKWWWWATINLNWRWLTKCCCFEFLPNPHSLTESLPAKAWV